MYIILDTDMAERIWNINVLDSIDLTKPGRIEIFASIQRFYTGSTLNNKTVSFISV